MPPKKDSPDKKKTRSKSVNFKPVAERLIDPHGPSQADLYEKIRSMTSEAPQAPESEMELPPGGGEGGPARLHISRGRHKTTASVKKIQSSIEGTERRTERANSERARSRSARLKEKRNTDADVLMEVIEENVAKNAELVARAQQAEEEAAIAKAQSYASQTVAEAVRSENEVLHETARNLAASLISPTTALRSKQLNTSETVTSNVIQQGLQDRRSRSVVNRLTDRNAQVQVRREIPSQQQLQVASSGGAPPPGPPGGSTTALVEDLPSPPHLNLQITPEQIQAEIDARVNVIAAQLVSKLNEVTAQIQASHDDIINRTQQELAVVKDELAQTKVAVASSSPPPGPPPPGSEASPTPDEPDGGKGPPATKVKERGGSPGPPGGDPSPEPIHEPPPEQPPPREPDKHHPPPHGDPPEPEPGPSAEVAMDDDSDDEGLLDQIDMSEHNTGIKWVYTGTLMERFGKYGRGTEDLAARYAKGSLWEKYAHYGLKLTDPKFVYPNKPMQPPLKSR